MSAKHVMISQSKALCGRQVTQGSGADCKNCARVSDANSKRVAAKVITFDDVNNPGNAWTTEQIEARAAAEGPIREAYRAAQSKPMDNPDASKVPPIGTPVRTPEGYVGRIESRYSDGRVNVIVGDMCHVVDGMSVTVLEESTPPAIPGYYWMRHNGHTSVENGPTVRTTDTYQLCRAGDSRVLATISHKAGFRWVPSGCWFISTLLCESWDGVSLADAFDRIKTYVRECEWAYTGDHYARVSAGDNARKGQPFMSREDIRREVITAIEGTGEVKRADDDFDVDKIVTLIVAYYGRVKIDTIPAYSFWDMVQKASRPVVPVRPALIKTPIRTLLGRRERRVMRRAKRKHKPSKVRVR